jgi:hypothetical protein
MTGHAVIGVHNGIARTVTVGGVELTAVLGAEVTVDVSTGLVIIRVPITSYEMRERRDDA